MIFVVDASGSTAAARLAEAKGAVELLLSRAYERREDVALVAFRGKGAEILLPPTRSMALARRRLAALPGGGGTPLASGLMTALDLSRVVAERGATPFLALLTDGQANIDLEGAPGREGADRDARRAAGLVRANAHRGVLIDTSTRPRASAQMFASFAGLDYAPLPFASSARLSEAVKAASRS